MQLDSIYRRGNPPFYKLTKTNQMDKIKFLILALCFGTISVFAQTTKQYEYHYVDDNGYSFKSFFFNSPTENLFILKDDRKSGSNENHEGMAYKVYNDKWSKVFYQSKNQNITRIPIYGKEIVYYSNELKSEIKLTDNKRVISKYKCQEAIVKKGGRTYSVWFTNEIPLKKGPLNINGLPGLIVEMSDKSSKHFSLTLTNIADLSNSTDFNNYKKFILSKKPLDLENYNSSVVKIFTNVKRENYAILAKMNATIELAEDQRYFTTHLVDIPKNLVSELQKIKQ